jgi:hypothetical protein
LQALSNRDPGADCEPIVPFGGHGEGADSQGEIDAENEIHSRVKLALEIREPALGSIK